MKIIVRCHPKRQEFTNYLVKCLPSETIFSSDIHSEGARANFLKALSIAGSQAALHLEEDIILTQDFLQKVSQVIKKYSSFVIQFYSQGKSDSITGSRFEHGAKFLGCLCFYLPPGYSKLLLEHYPHWQTKDKYIAGSDLLLADWLKSRNEIYFVNIPSLVQHRDQESLIYKNREERKSSTFIDPMY